MPRSVRARKCGGTKIGTYLPGGTAMKTESKTRTLVYILVFGSILFWLTDCAKHNESEIQRIPVDTALIWMDEDTILNGRDSDE